MAAAPSDFAIITSRRGTSCSGGCLHIHSYTADGIRWCWRPARPERRVRYAVDVELEVAPPPALARRLRTDEDFWRAWTRLEVVAKLLDVPALTLVGRGQLGAPPPLGISIEYVELDGALACLGHTS
ncbi:MAG: hypothetical protein E7L00_10165 [Propionibacteriaceae bacterium]|nr:hypothetical protein [Propionibacteriaceae bacterium]